MVCEMMVMVRINKPSSYSGQNFVFRALSYAFIAPLAIIVVL